MMDSQLPNPWRSTPCMQAATAQLAQHGVTRRLMLNSRSLWDSVAEVSCQGLVFAEELQNIRSYPLPYPAPRQVRPCLEATRT